VVQANVARAFQKQAHHYDLRRRAAWKPSIGDIVWKRLHTLSSKRYAINTKLAPKLSGRSRRERLFLLSWTCVAHRGSGTDTHTYTLSRHRKVKIINNKASSIKALKILD